MDSDFKSLDKWGMPIFLCLISPLGLAATRIIRFIMGSSPIASAVMKSLSDILDISQITFIVVALISINTSLALLCWGLFRILWKLLWRKAEQRGDDEVRVKGIL